MRGQHGGDGGGVHVGGQEDQVVMHWVPASARSYAVLERCMGLNLKRGNSKLLEESQARGISWSGIRVC